MLVIVCFDISFNRMCDIKSLLAHSKERLQLPCDISASRNLGEYSADLTPILATKDFRNEDRRIPTACTRASA